MRPSLRRVAACGAGAGVTTAALGGGVSAFLDFWTNSTARTMLAAAPTICATIRPRNEIHALRTLSFFFFFGADAPGPGDDAVVGGTASGAAPDGAESSSIWPPAIIALLPSSSRAPA